jgi:hypothetical protein
MAEDKGAFTRLIDALNDGCAAIFKMFGMVGNVLLFILKLLAGQPNQNGKNKEATS